MAKGRSGEAADELEPVEVEYTIEIAAKGGRWRAVIEDLEVEFEGRSKADAVSQVQGRAFAALASRIKGGGIALPGPLRLAFVVREYGGEE
jgi:hypothetical protein